MIRISLLLRIFDSAYMQRWNDKPRPIEFIELDKQAHKMVIAYVLGKLEEENGGISWIEIIEGGIFELLQRIVVTDLKPPIFYKIKSDPEKYETLRKNVVKEWEQLISNMDDEFFQRFNDYFSNYEETKNKKILEYAHLKASYWEFKFIKNINPGGFEIEDVEKNLIDQIERYSELECVKSLSAKPSILKFIDLCAQLRFQARWSNLHRIPKTSVLGHSLFVAIMSYLFSLTNGASHERTFNNYFTGLFHDLPEVLTRDIISPVKRSIPGLDELIKKYEKEEMDIIYKLVPEEWHKELGLFCENEFEDITDPSNGELIRDGDIIKACDHLAAFIEAREAIKNGCSSINFQETLITLRNEYDRRNIKDINFGELYADLML
ncbi:MAG: HD domain-containing protein [Deltaproteobacteria bacterium]